MSRILTAAFFLLTLSAPALADTVPAGAMVWSHHPTGVGSPGAISCYQAVAIGSHIRNLQCARNSVWARINKGPALLPQAVTMAGGGEILAANNR